MSALRKVAELEYSSVSSFEITDCFTKDFNIYLITSDRGCSYGYFRFINSAGSVDTRSLYDTARYFLKPNTTSTESINENASYGFWFPELTSLGGNEMTVYTPYQSDVCTYVSFSSAIYDSSTSNRFVKGIGRLVSMSRNTGFKVYAESGTISGKVSVYGYNIKGYESST